VVCISNNDYLAPFPRYFHIYSDLDKLVATHYVDGHVLANEHQTSLDEAISAIDCFISLALDKQHVAWSHETILTGAAISNRLLGPTWA